MVALRNGDGNRGSTSALVLVLVLVVILSVLLLVEQVVAHGAALGMVLLVKLGLNSNIQGGKIQKYIYVQECRKNPM